MLNHVTEIDHLMVPIWNSTFKPRSARTLVLVLLLLWAMSFSLYQIKQVKGQTLTVGPDGPPVYDYEKIEYAVGNATAGDTIQVAAGIYHEHIYINKSLTMEGENPQTTIVDGSGNGEVFDLDATHITITGFTIRNAGNAYSAITITRDVPSSDFDVISNNIITTSLNGILLSLSDQNTISNNNITTTSEYGISLSGSHKNTILSNTFIDNPFGGIYMVSSSNENITGNTITDSAYGIRGSSSPNNIIEGNTITQTSYAIHLTQSSTGNKIRRNIVVGKTAGIYITSDNTIADHNTAIDGSSGLYFANCKNGSIYYNTILNSSYGIRLWASVATTSIHKVNNNKITNAEWGIYLESSNGNTITGNWLQQNTWGIYMVPSSSNTIYHNDFVNNDRGASIAAGSGNIWDVSGQGNYWSDYPPSGDTDGDGIGEIPYPIPPGADNNPLIRTWSEHDISVVSVTPSTNNAQVGSIVDITVQVRNNANITALASFTITAKYNSTIIGTQTVNDLGKGSIATRTFNWNTAGVTLGNYTISALATTVPDELNTDNNNFVDGTVKVTTTLIGDINRDGTVNNTDLDLLNQAYGLKQGDPNWNPDIDLNKDNQIDVEDLNMLSREYGKTA